MWLDIIDPDSPCIVWQDGDILDRNRVKLKDRLSLMDIIDIKSGIATPSLRRSGKPQFNDRYMSFCGEERTFDIELPTAEARDWIFKKFADMFQAYATAKQEGLVGDAVTIRVSEIIDRPAKARTNDALARPGNVGNKRFAGVSGFDVGLVAAPTGNINHSRVRSPRVASMDAEEQQLQQQARGAF
jgi:hypothetical protein